MSLREYRFSTKIEVESTEAVRKALQHDREEPLTVFTHLRGDCRSRTASFLRYLSLLAEEGIVERVHVAGALTDVFAHKAAFPVTQHDEFNETAGDILDEVLAEGRPVYIVGNTVAEFMRDREDAITE